MERKDSEDRVLDVGIECMVNVTRSLMLMKLLGLHKFLRHVRIFECLNAYREGTIWKDLPICAVCGQGSLN